MAHGESDAVPVEAGFSRQMRVSGAHFRFCEAAPIAEREGMVRVSALFRLLRFFAEELGVDADLPVVGVALSLYD